MKEGVSIPVKDQIEALVNGQIDWLLKSWYGRAPIDPVPYITATRRDIEQYFRDNPGVASRYAEKYQDNDVDHDVNRLDRHGEVYVVASWDHGTPMSERRFTSIASACAEHLLRQYGLPLT
jgi:hypothetical protein